MKEKKQKPKDFHTRTFELQLENQSEPEEDSLKEHERLKQRVKEILGK